MTLATLVPVEAMAQPVGSCETGQAWADLDINGVSARIYNSGGLFWNGYGSHLEIPAGSGSNSIFVTDIWIGGLVNGELRMVATDYGPWELWPGPIEDIDHPPADCSKYDRIYKVSRRDLSVLDETGVAAPDILDWPWQLGAPVDDGDGDPDNYNLAAGDRPRIEGDQMLWWVMNDVGNSHNWSLTPPIGLEVQVSAFAASSTVGEINYTTFYRYKLINKSDHDIEDAYFGQFADADYGFDYVGSDTTNGLAYLWNGTDEGHPSRMYGGKPPALGFTLVDGPRVNGVSLGITGFITYSNDSTVQGTPDSGEDAYRYLQGLWRDGRPVTYGGSGRGFSEIPVKFMYPGRPPAFWSEEDTDGDGSRDTPSFSKWTLWSSGPFTLRAEESQEVTVAMIWVQGQDRFDSVYKLIDSIPRVKQAYLAGLPTFQGSRPTGRPELASPADAVAGQPPSLNLSWDEAANADGYEIELLPRDSASMRRLIRSTPYPTNDHDVFNYKAEVDASSQYRWRVRASNAAGFGPWSETRSFSTSDVELVARGPLWIDGSGGSPAFVQVEGIGDDDACGPDAGSTFGCFDVGGNYVYGSYNGQINWIMYHSGPGPEQSIGDFAPNDFEIRATEAGSYAYHPFDDGWDGVAHWVPLEVWDIGDVGPFGINDTSDDIQLIANIYSEGGGQCLFGFGDLAEDPFGFGWPGTDELYAYYPKGDDYAAFEAAVKPLVDADPEGCPASPETDAASALIDFDRGRPLQRLVWYMDPGATSYCPDFIPVGNVIRFFTTRPVPPVLSAPGPGAVVSSDVALYWQLPPDADSSRVQVFLYGDPISQVVDTAVAGNSHALHDLAAGVYLWRTSYGKEQDEWSEPWTFTVVPGTATEDDDTGLPTELELKPAYPNPFVGQTTFTIGLPKPGRISLNVYDLLGRRVETIADADRTAGWHTLTWEPGPIASGMYFITLESDGARQVQPVVVTK